jgi:hypothetical protein
MPLGKVVDGTMTAVSSLLEDPKVSTWNTSLAFDATLLPTYKTSSGIANLDVSVVWKRHVPEILTPVKLVHRVELKPILGSSD